MGLPSDVVFQTTTAPPARSKLISGPRAKPPKVVDEYDTPKFSPKPAPQPSLTPTPTLPEPVMPSSPNLPKALQELRAIWSSRKLSRKMLGVSGAAGDDSGGRSISALRDVTEQPTVTTRVEKRIRAYYLGTCEESPIADIQPFYYHLYTDATGGYIGCGEDDVFLGETATVRADLSRWNENVYAAIAAKPRAGSGRGRSQRLDVGTLMVGESFAYRLWIYFPYWSKQIPPPLGPLSGTLGAAVGLASGGMPAGYRFLRAYLIAPERLYPMGTRPRKISLVWQCRYERLFHKDTVGGGFELYDHDLSGLPDPD